LIHTNFKVLFEAWGVELKKAQVKATKISISSALKLAGK
jgi:hypothetical protein